MIDVFTSPLKPAEGLTPTAGEESELHHWSCSHATSKQGNQAITCTFTAAVMQPSFLIPLKKQLFSISPCYLVTA